MILLNRTGSLIHQGPARIPDTRSNHFPLISSKEYSMDKRDQPEWVKEVTRMLDRMKNRSQFTKANRR